MGLIYLDEANSNSVVYNSVIDSIDTFNKNNKKQIVLFYYSLDDLVVLSSGVSNLNNRINDILNIIKNWETNTNMHHIYKDLKVTMKNKKFSIYTLRINTNHRFSFIILKNYFCVFSLYKHPETRFNNTNINRIVAPLDNNLVNKYNKSIESMLI